MKGAPAPFANVRFHFEEDESHTPGPRPGTSRNDRGFFHHSQTERPIEETIATDFDILGAFSQRGDNWLEQIEHIGASAPDNGTPFSEMPRHSGEDNRQCSRLYHHTLTHRLLTHNQALL